MHRWPRLKEPHSHSISWQRRCCRCVCVCVCRTRVRSCFLDPQMFNSDEPTRSLLMFSHRVIHSESHYRCILYSVCETQFLIFILMIMVLSSSAPSSSRVAPHPHLCSGGTARQRIVLLAVHQSDSNCSHSSPEIPYRSRASRLSAPLCTATAYRSLFICFSLVL